MSYSKQPSRITSLCDVRQNMFVWFIFLTEGDLLSLRMKTLTVLLCFAFLSKSSQKNHGI